MFMKMAKPDIFKENRKIRIFYTFEGKLATTPILNFLIAVSGTVSGVVVDFGCGEMVYKSLFQEKAKYIGIDLYNNHADLVEDITRTSLPTNYADYILCNQVLEHDPAPGEIICEINRVLKNNGILILSAPQMGRLHGEPHDYYRFTKYGLEYLLKKNGFRIVYLAPHGGFFRAFGSHINFLIAEKCFGHFFFEFVLRHTIIRLNNIICPFLDKLIPFEKDTLGYNIIAIKCENENV